jgi:RNA-directed DNA polymerase
MPVLPMPKRHDDLFGRIASFAALRSAVRRAVCGKRKKPGASAFFAHLEGELLRLERELRDGTYRPGRYVEIKVRDPKERIVSAAPFRDRVVHHALCAVIGPLFERGFFGNTFANRVGKGTHRAIEAYERYRDRHALVLRCDLYRYFPSIDHHAILKAEFRRRIACAGTLALMDAIVDGSNAQEPVDLHFPGDDLFEPHRRRRGLPIGNLTSQFFANLYLDCFDHFVTEVLRASYVRYVDDFALFHDDPTVLAEWRARIARYLEGRRLKLHPRKTAILATAEPSAFLGFVLMPGGRRRLPEDNVARFRNRLRGLRDRWRAGAVTRAEVEAKVGAWIAHAENADTWRLRQAVFGGGWFGARPWRQCGVHVVGRRNEYPYTNRPVYKQADQAMHRPEA